MKIAKKDFEFERLSTGSEEEILSLQERVIDSLEDKSLLRRNTREMFADCVKEPNVSVGVRFNDRLVGIGVLYVPTSMGEDLSHLLVNVEIQNKKTANYKLCMVEKDFRGNGLQVELGKILEEKAKEKGIELLCATVSPDNVYSRNNMLRLGYTLNTTLPKYGSIRDLFYKFI